MKILFGGTFDPLHNGHLDLALQVSQQFQHPVSLMPLSGVPNYKAPPIATIKQRLQMLEIVQQEYPAQLAIEYNEAKLTEYSPTVFTLRRLRKIYGNDEPMYFIIGGDSLVSLDKYWDEWQNLFGLTNFIVAMRPDYDLSLMSEQLSQQVTPRITKQCNSMLPSGEIIMIDFAPHPVSSTIIRNELKQNNNVDKFIPQSINNYIIKNQLYKGK